MGRQVIFGNSAGVLAGSDPPASNRRVTESAAVNFDYFQSSVRNGEAGRPSLL